MRKQSDLERELEFEINSLRMLMVLECEEEECGGGRHFHQILPTREQFKTISDTLCTPMSDPDENGYHECSLQVSEDSLPAEPFEGLATTDD